MKKKVQSKLGSKVIIRLHLVSRGGAAVGGAVELPTKDKGYSIVPTDDKEGAV